jgi:hypothetical protein
MYAELDRILVQKSNIIKDLNQAHIKLVHLNSQISSEKQNLQIQE